MPLFFIKPVRTKVFTGFSFFGDQNFLREISKENFESAIFRNPLYTLRLPFILFFLIIFSQKSYSADCSATLLTPAALLKEILDPEKPIPFAAIKIEDLDKLADAAIRHFDKVSDLIVSDYMPPSFDYTYKMIDSVLTDIGVVESLLGSVYMSLLNDKVTEAVEKKFTEAALRLKSKMFLDHTLWLRLWIARANSPKASRKLCV
jgi:hypothetical protein